MPSDPDGRTPRRGRGTEPRRRGRGTEPRRRSGEDPRRSRAAGRGASGPPGAPRRNARGRSRDRGTSPDPAQRDARPPGGGRLSAILTAAARHPGKSAVAVIAAVLIVITGFAWQQVDTLKSGLTTAGGLGLGEGKDGAIDILMVGIDSRTDAKGNPLSPAELETLRAGEAEATNTDTIILIRIPNDGSSATAVSIPRDSYVDVPGLGKSKINAAYGETKELTRERLVEQGTDPAAAERQGTKAGRQALLQAVTDLTGITVDHYAEVGLLGFVLLTNAVGGVPVCLNEAVDDPYSGAQFPAGEQTLHGADALSFVRQRHGLPRGDLDRIVRQQAYLASLAHRVLSAKLLASPSKLNELSSAVERSIVVDSGWDVIGFARQLQNLSDGAVTFRTIPVADPSATSPDGESIVQVDPTTVHDFFTGLVDRSGDGTGNSDGTEGDGDETGDGDTASSADADGRLDVDPADVRVDVLNASAVGGLASSVSDALAGVGYRTGQVANFPGSAPSSSQVRAAPGGEDDARAVARALGGLDVVSDASLAPGTVSVVLAGAYSGPGSSEWSGPVTDGTDGASRPATGPHDPAGTDAAPGAGAEDNPVGPAVTAGDGPRCVN